MDMGSKKPGNVFIRFRRVIIYVVIKGRFFRAFGIILSDPILLSSFIYVILFAGLIALSTNNFGTLVRYKLPCMPFWSLVLFITLAKLKDRDKKTILG
jgi:hypothetical protein